MARPLALIAASVKSVMPKSLMGRSLMIIVTPLIVVQAASAYAFFSSHWNLVANIMTRSITGEIAVAIDSLVEKPDEFTQLIERMEERLDVEFTFFPGQIIDTEAAASQKFGFFNRHLGRQLEEQIKRPYLINSETFSAQTVVQIQLAGGVMQAVIPRERIFSSANSIFMLWMVGSSLVIFIVASLFMRNQVRPILNLARVADLFGKDQTVYENPEESLVNLKIQGATEVRQAALAFNRMSERIFRQMRQRTDMLSGVSHDLRTPLTRMKLQLAMSKGQDDIKALEQDIQEMESMINAYLAFAKGETGEAVRAIALTTLLKEISLDASREGLSIHSHLEGDFSISARPNALKRCLNNLVSNAGRHGRNIWLQAGKRHDNMEIFIDDDGPGIPEDQREKAFRPFFRLDYSRNPLTGGTGLGLTIARDIARLHGGDISLARSPQGGVRAKITLPL